MSPIGSLGQSFAPSSMSGPSAARSADTDNGLGNIAEGFSGIEGLTGGNNTAAFSTGNPGFGSRGNSGGFSVQDFLG